MKTPRHTRILLGLAAVAAVGLAWWLFSPGGQGAAPVAATPTPVGHRAEMAPAPVAPSPLAATEPAAVEDYRVERAPVQAATAAAPAVAATSASSLQPSAVIAAPLPPALIADEVAATERMYLAHASLRDPEVADPDSETNRRILQAMVTKALQAPAADSHTVAPAN